jgi:hypothetical protein
MSMEFGYGSALSSESSTPLPPPVKCKVCSFEYHPSSETFGGPIIDACPRCAEAKARADKNNQKLALATKNKDAITPATFAQMEELIAIAKKSEEHSKSIRSAVWGLWWGIFGMWALVCIGYFIVGS